MDTWTTDNAQSYTSQYNLNLTWTHKVDVIDWDKLFDYFDALTYLLR